MKTLQLHPLAWAAGRTGIPPQWRPHEGGEAVALVVTAWAPGQLMRLHDSLLQRMAAQGRRVSSRHSQADNHVAYQRQGGHLAHTAVQNCSTRTVENGAPPAGNALG